MPEVFFTADSHFGHKMLVKDKLRPFDSIEEMDEAMIDRWNELVGNHDVVYHLGDLSFHPTLETVKIIGRLNGQIRLVKGNHDHYKGLVTQNFQWYMTYYEIKKLEGATLAHKIVLCHYPFETWNGCHHGTWHLHGHSHGSLNTRPNIRRLDVCVEDHEYRPYHYDEILEIMQTRVHEPVDHHR